MRMILYSKVIKSFWCLLLCFINISLLSSLRSRWFHLLSWLLWFCQESSHVFLWVAFAAIFCWDLAAISLDSFDSNIMVSFGSNSLWAALVAIFLVRFGSNFSGRLWQQYLLLWFCFTFLNSCWRMTGQCLYLVILDISCRQKHMKRVCTDLILILTKYTK